MAKALNNMVIHVSTVRSRKAGREVYNAHLDQYNLTATEREVQLERCRVCDRARHASQSCQDIEVWYQQLRVSQQERIATETIKEREARLQ